MKTASTHKLGDIIDVLAGYSFRSALLYDPRGNISVVQAKDVRNVLSIDPIQLQRISMECKSDRFIQRGDVILSSRGFFDAAVYDSDARAIASASVYLLRPKTDILLSEYLAIFLKTRKGQSLIKQYETGAAIKTILIKDLRDIEITVPDREEQQLIVDLYKNIGRQEDLMLKKINLYKRIFNALL